MKIFHTPNSSFIFAAFVMAFFVQTSAVHAQKVGIGSVAFTPVNRLDVKGNAVIGDTYSGVSTAPTNGLLIEGNTGIGTVLPQKKLDIRGDIQVGDPTIWSSTAQNHYIN